MYRLVVACRLSSISSGTGALSLNRISKAEGSNKLGFIGGFLDHHVA